MSQQPEHEIEVKIKTAIADNRNAELKHQSSSVYTRKLWYGQSGAWGHNERTHPIFSDEEERKKDIKVFMSRWSKRYSNLLSDNDIGLDLGGAGSSSLYLPKK